MHGIQDISHNTVTVHSLQIFWAPHKKELFINAACLIKLKDILPVIWQRLWNNRTSSFNMIFQFSLPECDTICSIMFRYNLLWQRLIARCLIHLLPGVLLHRCHPRCYFLQWNKFVSYESLDLPQHIMWECLIQVWVVRQMLKAKFKIYSMADCHLT